MRTMKQLKEDGDIKLSSRGAERIAILNNNNMIVLYVDIIIYNILFFSWENKRVESSKEEVGLQGIPLLSILSRWNLKYLWFNEYRFPTGSWKFGSGTQEWSERQTNVSLRVICMEEIVEAVQGSEFLRMRDEWVFVKCLHFVFRGRKQSTGDGRCSQKVAEAQEQSHCPGRECFKKMERMVNRANIIHCSYRGG